jgi:tetratricopeptide (TPR) repeat protein
VRQSVLPVLLLTASALWHAPAQAEDAGAIVREGNRLYEQGKFVEAAERFEQAAALAADSPVPLFNRAAALFQAGDFEQAASLYEQARLRAPAELRQRINYALGNCHLQQAMSSRAQAGRATQEAQSAVQFYRDAIRSTTSDPTAAAVSDSARHNLEIAKRLIKQIEQQKQQTSEPEEQSEKDQNRQQQPRDQDSQQRDPDQPQDAGRQQTGEPTPQPAGPSPSDELTPEEAAERLRAAIARAQLARARRLPDRDKKAKQAPVEKDW